MQGLVGLLTGGGRGLLLMECQLLPTHLAPKTLLEPQNTLLRRCAKLHCNVSVWGDLAVVMAR